MGSVALLGTGLLGFGFAEGVLERGGNELHVWNRTRSKAAPLGERGARVADTPAEAVERSDIVHLVLLDDAVVDETIAAMRPGLSAGTVIVDHTTNLPALVAERSKRLADEGVEYLHAPVFMSPMAARNAQGIMMVAGPTALFQKVKGLLSPMTGDLWYVGERPDLAACYKLFGNAMILTMAGGISDVFHMADALNVERTDAWGLFSRFRIDGILNIRAMRILEENYDASFALEVARKDARLMLESAGDQPVPVLQAIATRMDEMLAKGFGEMDMAVLAKRGE
ncbi:MAG: NAD(P)-binding domain-containing protein [Gemmatimonadaceae bacterium]